MAPAFSDWQLAVLRIAQGNLPDTPTPFADMAKLAGVGEGKVLEFLRDLKKSGAIRRFGASIRHQKTGWDCNAMVAWIASPEQAEACGPLAAARDNISHAYYRPSSAPDWPYTFYTMIHGRNDTECMDTVKALAASWPLKEYAVLRSIRELKKTSMAYFA